MLRAVCISVVALFHFHAAAVGGDMSGGGGAFVCNNPDGTMSAHLLDLWEAEVLPGFKDLVEVQYSNEEIGVQLNRAVTRLHAVDQRFYDDVAAELQFLRNTQNHAMLGDEIEIDAPTDTGHHFSKPGCPLKGLAFYDDTQKKLAIKASYYQALKSETDRAALWLHEAVYKVLRERDKQTTSVDSRRFVACLLSQTPCWESAPIVSRLPMSSTVYKCVGETSGTVLYSYLVSGNRWRLMFENLGEYIYYHPNDASGNYRYTNIYRSGLELDIEIIPGVGGSTELYSPVAKFVNYHAGNYFYRRIVVSDAFDDGRVANLRVSNLAIEPYTCSVFPH